MVEERDIAGSITVKTRFNLALHHLLAACRGCAAVKQIETANLGQPYGPFWEEILHHSLAVSTLSVAALEAYANQLYRDNALEKGGLKSAAAREIEALVDRERILTKYSLILSIVKGSQLDHGVAPVQNAVALIKLRNAVVHFQPEWFDDQVEHRRLSGILATKFQPSPFLQGERIFPRAWATHSFADWAIRTTVSFIDHFHGQLGTESYVDRWRKRMSELSGCAL